MPLYLLKTPLEIFYELASTLKDYLKQVVDLLRDIGIVDIIDILFVAFVIYTVIRIIRDTRAFQLLKGIIFLLVLYAIVSVLGMEASSYIFKEIFKNILIILIILFGPEIRNVLEQMGKGAYRRGFKSLFGNGVNDVDMKKTIDAVCKACTAMSDDKVGALIVFENETMLGEVIASGSIINASPSSILIENIFFPKSPLHDGAMIIRGSQVYAAGCILPLTRDNVSSSLGTRHRAAIGMSQESDAVIVVVSEETGQISVAQNGSLERDISSGQLRDILEQEFMPTDNKSDDRFLKRLIRRNK
ncbi:MAG: diadenylate cyclase CdaA [Eubacterium sp.]|nr:diadenylate cyclase CdaA [Eubacterium sp.]